MKIEILNSVAQMIDNNNNSNNNESNNCSQKIVEFFQQLSELKSDKDAEIRELKNKLGLVQSKLTVVTETQKTQFNELGSKLGTMENIIGEK